MLINEVDFEIKGDSADKYFSAYASVGTYSDDVTSYLKSVIKDNWVCADVGANIGLMSIHMIQCARNVSVVAFEPSPKNVSYLMSNLNQNRIYDVSIVPIGLGSERGFVQFVDLPEFGAGSHVKATVDHPDAIGVKTIAIKIDTLDNYFKAVNCDRLDLIKIDAEGYELNVLRGSIQSLRRYQPLVIVEFNSWFIEHVQRGQSGEVLAELFDMFERLEVISGDSSRVIENSKSGRNEFLDATRQHTLANLVCGFNRGERRATVSS